MVASENHLPTKKRSNVVYHDEDERDHFLRQRHAPADLEAADCHSDDKPEGVMCPEHVHRFYRTVDKVLAFFAIPEDRKVWSPFSSVWKFTVFFALIVVADSLYMETLEGCYDELEKCVAWMLEIKSFWIRLAIQSSILMSLMLWYSILTSTQKHIVPALVANLIFLNRYDTGASHETHGSINFILVIVMLLFVNSFLSCAWFGAKLFFRYKKTFITLAILLISTTAYFYTQILQPSCENWEFGLARTSANLEDGSCRLIEPQAQCWYDVGKGWLDLSRVAGLTQCSKVSTPSPYNSEGKVLAFPRTEDFSREEKSSYTSFQSAVLNRVDEVKNVPNAEVTLDHTADDPRILINLQRNNTMVEERLEKGKDNPVENPPNILILWIDAVARPHFMRMFPKTVAWMEDRYGTSDNPFQSYQFFKYHGLYDFTKPHFQKFFFGRPLTKEDTDTPMYEDFRNQGYATAWSENGGMWDYTRNQSRYFKGNDHELLSVFYDPNYVFEGNPHRFETGPSSIFNRCLYGQNVNDFQFEYANQFWQKYPDVPKLYTMAFSEGHEGTGEVIQYLDEPLERFLNEFEAAHGDNTMIVMMSDHGLHMHGIYWSVEAQISEIEKGLPSLFLLAPKAVQQKYGSTFTTNSNRLVQISDIRQTISEVSGVKLNSEDIATPLTKEIPVDRSCDDIKLDPKRCLCTAA
mmetsp:Transcript_38364/g.43551  ORF Transcript_38364/g.43551 Transcript_38364/m.43551 type:complete len:691 (-) Transcript_38364:366-2438(-)|eukprot:CAMPEP_0115013564 /NCGR_PEP_ID=MMETSP0216-20121206/25493_1 /TAXON_ID=223996 /ORGANISM="Protocruzia adherens, Strain Boccale" /LENGTH=690 /DNA_ID=CAMNT_0002383007 /DNA_START=391 /DNA_END=2463 /DNA_ORIENTATION=+